MRNLLFASFLTLLVTGSPANAQLPPRQWALQYGGAGVDIPFSIKFTTDGGTIVAGYTDSKDGDVSPQPNREYWDLWVIKLDKCGVIEWERSFGGTGYESARDVIQTADGGYMVLGETNSTDGGVIAGFGGTKDIWLLKLSATGNLVWQKRYGGTGLDIGNHIQTSNDGGFVIAASSTSNDGDIRGNHSTGTYTDGVLMKLNSSGVVQWSKCFGGTRNEELFDIEIINGTTFAVGFSNSVDGDIPPNQKNYDVWLLAIDGNGNKVISKIFGGSQNDVAYCMSKGPDGSLTLAGYTTSADGDVSGPKGGQDYWILNVSQKGNLNCQCVLGGADAEYAKTIITDPEGGYIIGGVSYSEDGDRNNPLGDGDFWTVKLDPGGNLLWEHSWGGSSNDHLRFMIHDPARDEYYLAGDAESGDGDFGTARGDADFAVIKLKIPMAVDADTVVCEPATFIPYTDPLTDRCGYDSVIVTYRPVPLTSPFDGPGKADTIFLGESVTIQTNGQGNVSWNPHPSLSCFDCPSPVATPTTTTTYIATNLLPGGCRASDQFTVTVLRDAMVHMPTAFTPNRDGRNDYFGPIGKVPGHYKLQVYNRNGEVVFSSAAMNSRWNGLFRGAPQPAGVFIYLLEYNDMQNKVHMQKGTFVLIR